MLSATRSSSSLPRCHLYGQRRSLLDDGRLRLAAVAVAVAVIASVVVAVTVASAACVRASTTVVVRPAAAAATDLSPARRFHGLRSACGKEMRPGTLLFFFQRQDGVGSAVELVQLPPAVLGQHALRQCRIKQLALGGAKTDRLGAHVQAQLSPRAARWQWHVYDNVGRRLLPPQAALCQGRLCRQTLRRQEPFHLRIPVGADQHRRAWV
mmetsp:Transcript_47433/g.146574  ORF Transcript_47433/g.146574 Transcript_47433/m.146574 type:complete len:210 (-) Transcript_47433:668-1297(-)